MFTTICDPILENNPYSGIFEFWVIIIITEAVEKEKEREKWKLKTNLKDMQPNMSYMPE